MQGQGGRSRGNGISIHASDVVWTNGLCGVGTRGDAKKAQRLDSPTNIRWRITVEPDSNGDVTVVLPETANCDAQGAICAKVGSGRMLSNRLQFTVSGPWQ